MIRIYKNNDKVLKFTRKYVNGETIETVPQSIVFAVREGFEKPVLIQKTLGNGIEQNEDKSWSIFIQAADTKGFVLTSAKSYKADVQIVDELGRTLTIVAPFDLLIMPVVAVSNTDKSEA